MKVIYIGSTSETAGKVSLKPVFGQEIEIAPEHARDVLGDGGLPFLPPHQFRAINFSDAEIAQARQIGTPRGLLNPTPELLGKLNAASDEWQKWKTENFAMKEESDGVRE